MNCAPSAPERALTLNDRLSRALEGYNIQCERIESVLSRVNGTPQKIEGGKPGQAPRPVYAMQATIENLEATLSRLAELTGGLERIA